MRIKAKFTENEQKLNAKFGEYQDLSDGGFEKGYEAGYNKGYINGNNDGNAEGYKQGYDAGETQMENVLVSFLNRTITEFETDQHVTNLCSYIFSDCKQLERIKIDSVVTIGSCALQRCDALTSVCFPNCTTVSATAFFFDKNLQVADFPKLTTFNGTQIFAYCSKLETLIIRTETGICQLSSSSIFAQNPISRGTGYIYVPRSLIDTYKSATNWTVFANQFRAIEDYPDICDPSN